MTYSTLSRVWTTTLEASIIPTTINARNNTPISATIQANSPNQPLDTIILYVTSNHSLAAAQFGSGIWSDATVNLNVSQFSTSPTTRSLSLATIPGTTNSSELLLYYEDIKGEVAVLHGTHSLVLPFFTPTILWSWKDITGELVQPLSSASPVSLQPPFVTAKSYNYSRRNDSILSNSLTTSLFDLSGGTNSTFVSAFFRQNNSTCKYRYTFLLSQKSPANLTTSRYSRIIFQWLCNIKLLSSRACRYFRNQSI